MRGSAAEMLAFYVTVLVAFVNRNTRKRVPYRRLPAATRNPRGGGGGTLIFSHIRRLSPFFFKILNFNIFLGFQKNEYFLGVLRFCGYFWGVITKLG